MAIAILVLTPRQSYCQDRGEGLLRFDAKQITVMGEGVLIDCDIVLSEYEISSDEQTVLTPFIIDDRGNVFKLKPVIINGSRRDKIYKRMLSFDGLKDDSYSTLRSRSKRLTTTIPYRATVPLERWMLGASVRLNEDKCGCGGINLDSNELIAGRIASPEAPVFDFAYTPQIQFVAPPKEEIKNREEAGEAYITFRVGRYEILPDFGNNRAELAKINESLEFVRGESTAIINGISILAYASPEGTYPSNMTLSQNRANSLSQYVRSTYSVQSSIPFTSKGMGEDWNGLIKQVESDQTMNDKADVLRIISSVSEPDRRDAPFRALSGGRTYNYMLNTLYPYLRRSDYKIEYTVPSFSIEKGKELLKTSPSMLSVEEMYHIAGTYDKGSKEYIDLFNLALQIFPDDSYANINAAASALLEDNHERAGRLLEKYIGNPIAWNNYGVVMMKELRLSEARGYLERANVAGVPEARQNLEILGRLQQAVDEFQAKKEEYDAYREGVDSLNNR